MARLVIVEGPQGAGKTTITNWLREQMTSTNLLRLSGVADRGEGAGKKSYEYHHQVLNMIQYSHDCDVNWILDRSFMSEYVYCALGYHPYKFGQAALRLCNQLNEISHYYQVDCINLFISQPSHYRDRLERQKGEYEKYDTNKSIDQQSAYSEAWHEARCLLNRDIDIHDIDTLFMPECLRELTNILRIDKSVTSSFVSFVHSTNHLIVKDGKLTVDDDQHNMKDGNNQK